MANNGGSSWGPLLAASYIITVHHQVQHTASHDAAAAPAAAGWKRLPSRQFGCNCNKGSRKRLIANWQQPENLQLQIHLHLPLLLPSGPFVIGLQACDMLTRLAAVATTCLPPANCHLPQTVDCVRDCVWLCVDSFFAKTNPGSLFACCLLPSASLPASGWAIRLAFSRCLFVLAVAQSTWLGWLAPWLPGLAISRTNECSARWLRFLSIYTWSLSCLAKLVACLFRFTAHCIILRGMRLAYTERNRVLSG